jgi:hypothetical protein
MVQSVVKAWMLVMAKNFGWMELTLIKLFSLTLQTFLFKQDTSKEKGGSKVYGFHSPWPVKLAEF